MDLYDYYQKKRKENSKFTVKEFAEQLGIGRTQLNQIITGHRKPGLKKGLQIEEMTNGEVTYLDIVRHHMDTYKRETKKKLAQQKEKVQDSAVE